MGGGNIVVPACPTPTKSHLEISIGQRGEATRHMPKENITTTIFKHDRPFEKAEQERRVGEAFQVGYERATGIILEGNSEGRPDPPDREFSYRNSRVSAELVELEQRYSERALQEALLNKIYGEFEQQGDYLKYLGLTVQIPMTTDLTWEKNTRAEWQDIKKDPLGTVAKQFVQIFKDNVSSTESVPDSAILGAGLRIPIDARVYPALSILGHTLFISRCKPEDPRRSDGLAAPLVIIGGAFMINEAQMEESIQRAINNKIQKKAKYPEKWSAFNHSVLIAHDLPRDSMYQAFMMQWKKWLGNAVRRVNVLEVFDEVWLVTYQNAEPEAYWICGTRLD
jgi:hypothetical protein